MDDTDSREGMCTTFAGLKAILRIIELGYDIIGYPRLVRLNPNIPWKTRGNGSVVIRFGRGAGERIKIGEYRGEEIFAWTSQRKEDVKVSLGEILHGIEDLFVLDDEGTNPGVVLSGRKLPEGLYWRAVRGVLSVAEVEGILREHGAEYRKYKNGRGIIGASAGIAWRAKRRTYELLTYVEDSGGDRYVSAESVKRMDREIETTFDNYDYENDYVAIMPSSRTPVLFGIRGTSPPDLMRAREIVESSPYDSFLVYETNQGSDDHLVRKRIGEVKPYESVIIRGRVSREPRRIPGGHVIFEVSDPSGTIPCAAYEPTKGFREIVSRLAVGDEVEVYGGVRAEPLTVNIEKIRIIKTPPLRVKVANPICPVCGRRMESIGRGKGYRCRRCGTRAGEEDAEFITVERGIEGFHEVPVIARRHLSRPLKLMGNVF